MIAIAGYFIHVIYIVAVFLIVWLLHKDWILSDNPKKRSLIDTLEKLEAFQFRHLSSSRRPLRALSDARSGVEYVDVATLLDRAGITLAHGLTDMAWRSIAAHIHAVRFNKKKEREGVHPRVHTILQALRPIASLYDIVYDGQFVDIHDIIQKCDFSIVQPRDPPPAPMDLRMSSVLVPVEVTLPEELEFSVQQSMGYGASILLDRAELHGYNVLSEEHKIICIGTDGINMGMRLILMVRGELKFFSTGKAAIPLWPATGKARTETLGATILRTLMSAAPEQLGVQRYQRILRVNSYVHVQLHAVLGRGSFCCVYRGTVEINGVVDAIVAIKAPLLNSSRSSSVHKELFKREADVLFSFRHHQDVLPTLHGAAWARDTASNLFLCLRDVGLPLTQHAQGLNKAARAGQAAQLHTHLNEGLGAAHSLNVFHADLRPDNVIFVGNRFKIIDWGLAVPAGGLMHPYTGGLAFFADELVRSVSRGERIQFEPQFDRDSALMITFAFCEGDRDLGVPWLSLGGESLITARVLAMADFNV